MKKLKMKCCLATLIIALYSLPTFGTLWEGAVDGDPNSIWAWDWYLLDNNGNPVLSDLDLHLEFNSGPFISIGKNPFFIANDPNGGTIGASAFVDDGSDPNNVFYHRKEEGWELIGYSFGTATSPAEIPMLVLGNVYLSKIRVLYYTHNNINIASSSYQMAEVYINSNNSDEATYILNLMKGFTQSMEQDASTEDRVRVQGKISYNWSYIDIPMSYDRNDDPNKKQQLKIELKSVTQALVDQFNQGTNVIVENNENGNEFKAYSKNLYANIKAAAARYSHYYEPGSGFSNSTHQDYVHSGSIDIQLLSEFGTLFSPPNSGPQEVVDLQNAAFSGISDVYKNLAQQNWSEAGQGIDINLPAFEKGLKKVGKFLDKSLGFASIVPGGNLIAKNLLSNYFGSFFGSTNGQVPKSLGSVTQMRTFGEITTTTDDIGLSINLYENYGFADLKELPNVTRDDLSFWTIPENKEEYRYWFETPNFMVNPKADVFLEDVVLQVHLYFDQNGQPCETCQPVNDIHTIENYELSASDLVNGIDVLYKHNAGGGSPGNEWQYHKELNLDKSHYSISAKFLRKNGQFDPIYLMKKFKFEPNGNIQYLPITDVNFTSPSQFISIDGQGELNGNGDANSYSFPEASLKFPSHIITHSDFRVENDSFHKINFYQRMLQADFNNLGMAATFASPIINDYIAKITIKDPNDPNFINGEKEITLGKEDFELISLTNFPDTGEGLPFFDTILQFDFLLKENAEILKRKDDPDVSFFLDLVLMPNLSSSTQQGIEFRKMKFYPMTFGEKLRNYTTSSMGELFFNPPQLQISGSSAEYNLFNQLDTDKSGTLNANDLWTWSANKAFWELSIKSTESEFNLLSLNPSWNYFKDNYEGVNAQKGWPKNQTSPNPPNPFVSKLETQGSVIKAKVINPQETLSTTTWFFDIPNGYEVTSVIPSNENADLKFYHYTEGEMAGKLFVTLTPPIDTTYSYNSIVNTINNLEILDENDELFTLDIRAGETPITLSELKVIKAYANGIELEVEDTRNLRVNEGFNLISMPVKDVENDLEYQDFYSLSDVWEIYTDESVYGYEEAPYSATETLTPFVGYAAEGFSTNTFTLVGNKIFSYPLQLKEGWNLIAGITETASLSHYFANGVFLQGYKYNGGYEPVEPNSVFLEPGEAMWVYSEQEWNIDNFPYSLPENPLTKSTGDTTVTLSLGELLQLNSLAEFKVVSADSDTVKLYLANDSLQVNNQLFAKPPTPNIALDSLGFFDARIVLNDSVDTFAKVQNSNSINLTFRISASSTKYPVTISWLDALGSLQTSTIDSATGLSKPILKHSDGNETRVSLLDKQQSLVKINGLLKNNSIPLTYELSQNFPNPFNPVTTIKYSLPINSRVSIKIYNILGREVKTLISDTKEAGRYSIRWDGTNSDGKKASSGVYFYRIKTGDFVKTNKMLLLK